ncbi:hypothetical protein C8R44DRAFT_728640 [Mycena epipterygia]|nr:hypothetical protein C8R44DRAFT_728640 [Mycena epipterygia]
MSPIYDSRSGLTLTGFNFNFEPVAQWYMCVLALDLSISTERFVAWLKSRISPNFIYIQVVFSSSNRIRVSTRVAVYHNSWGESFKMTSRFNATLEIRITCTADPAASGARQSGSARMDAAGAEAVASGRTRHSETRDMERNGLCVRMFGV